MSKLTKGSFSTDEMQNLFDFAKTTAPPVISVLKKGQKLLCDPQVFSVRPGFFGKLGQTIIDCQWIRAGITLVQYAADRNPKKNEVLCVKSATCATLYKNRKSLKIRQVLALNLRPGICSFH